MSSPASNADIEYLVSMFEEELGLLRDYIAKEDIDPASRTYIRSFIAHVEQTSHTSNTDITDFIDYGTKLMAYLSKNGIGKIDVDAGAMNDIVNAMIRPDLLKEPIMEAISHKIKNNGSKQDIERLGEVLVELESQNINYEKVKEKMRQIGEI